MKDVETLSVSYFVSLPTLGATFGSTKLLGISPFANKNTTRGVVAPGVQYRGGPSVINGVITSEKWVTGVITLYL